MSGEFHKPGDWMKVLRRIRFTGARDGVRAATIKGVAAMLASYGNYKDGTDIHPGTARVAVDCEIDYRTAKRCIAALRDLGLITLVRKASRRGLADEYRLDIPEDLLERVEIELWDPSRYESEIDRLREKHRGRHVPQVLKEDSLRGTQSTADPGSANSVPEESAGPAGDRRFPSAVPAVPDLRGTPCPPTYQSTYQGFVVPSTSGDQTAHVLVPDDPNSGTSDSSASVDATSVRPRVKNRDSGVADVIAFDAARGTCPHGSSTRRNRQGRLRCEICRSAEDAEPKRGHP